MGNFLSSIKVPKYLFRYRSNATKYIWDELNKAISNREFYFSNAKSQNDPFEVFPIVVKPSPDKLLKVIERKFGKNPIVSRDVIEKQYGQSLSRQVHRRRNSELAPSIETAKFLADHMEKSFIDLNAHARMVCFNETPSSLPMWAHYANNHKGICLSFELVVADYNPGEKAPLPVTYANERPAIDIGTYVDSNYMTKDLESNGSTEFIRSIYLTKALDWQYEKEWRAFDNSTGSSNYSRVSILKPNAIILGINMDNGFKEKLLDQFENKVDILQASLSEAEYGLDFQKIN